MSTVEQKNVETVTAFIEDISNQSALDRTDQFFAGQMVEAFTDRRYIIDDILVQREKVIARILMEGTHKGIFAGNEPTGITVKATQFREFRVVDGKIAEHHGWFDTGTLLPQIQAPSI
ncbi:ester cyclase [Paenibacillus sp. sptzw28]|uniref:ester cyclase n=1 Tax=Paenibacillus sp. sptzw28 TaxID=715179 RepID=UPI001C6E866F|nr:ester cyclase [Paenibacillus sp. sptzw28]QYR22270.1 ester cyclase [Paenibacillus sp. sptzw28]